MGPIILLLNITKSQKKPTGKPLKQPPQFSGHLNSSKLGGTHKVIITYNKYW